MKILILYFSGVGNTKYVAEYMRKIISKYCDVDMKSIEKLSKDFDYSKYNKIILGSPTIHSEPSKPMQDFLNSIRKFENPIPAFIYVTYGLYPENVLRVFANLCIRKNIIPINYSAYRCIATDAKLLLPNIKFFQQNDTNIIKKIEDDIDKFINNNSLQFDKPPYKLYAILNFPNKYIGHFYRFKIFVDKEYCVKCNRCIINCPVSAINKDKSGYPIIDRKKCINCYRCIYNCPYTALSLFKNKRHNNIIRK